MATAKNTTVEFNEFLIGLRDLIDGMLGDGAPTTGPATKPAAKATPAKAKAAAVADDEDEEEDEDVDADPQAERRAELSAKTIAALKKIAIKAGFDAEDVEGADKNEIIESILADEAEAEEDEPEEEESEEEEDEDAEEGDEEEAEGYDRDDLEGLTLTALKKIAKDEMEMTTADLKGLDKDAVIDLIMGEEAEAEEDEEDEEAEDEEESEAYTEEDLAEMSLADLKALAKEWEVRLRPGMKKQAIIDALMAE